jgi:Uma2 family endonuclease
MGLSLHLPAQADQTRFNLERWAEVLNDPFFAELEHRIETDRHGQVIMTPPPSFSHSFRSHGIIRLLNEHLQEGEALHEVPVSTSDGVRAIDAAWLTKEHLAEARQQQVLLKAPAICVEVLSPRNREPEMKEKMALYFDAGASEVWLCGENGNLRFFTAPEGEAAHSTLVPEFPATVA